MDIELRVILDPTFRGPVEGAVAFETGATVEDLRNPDLLVYEHIGPIGALTRFYEDLILGRAMPLHMAIQGAKDIDTILAAALFLKRDLAIHPSMPGLVASCDLVHRYGATVLGHLESDLGRFLRLLRAYLPPNLGKEDTGARLVTAVEWVQDFVLNNRLPHLGRPWPDVRVLDRGTNGFVLAETVGFLDEGWVELYRQGFLRGVLVTPQDGQERRTVLVSRKSPYLPFDLGKASAILNDMERAMGEVPGWKTEGDLWLRGPAGGTLILLADLLKVLCLV